MSIRIPNARLLAVLLMLPAGGVAAQDVPGIEICTAEKTMERRTSCLQSNIDFLKRTMTKDVIEQQRKFDAAVREIKALKGQVEALKEAIAGLQKQPEAHGANQKEGPAADGRPKAAAK